jgi:hypothetical protein
MRSMPKTHHSKTQHSKTQHSKTQHTKRKSNSRHTVPGSARSHAQGRAGHQQSRSLSPTWRRATADLCSDVRVTQAVIGGIAGIAEARRAQVPPSPEVVAEQLIDCFAPLLAPHVGQLTVELTGAAVLDFLRRKQPDEGELTAALRGLVARASGRRTRVALAFLRLLTTAGPQDVRAAAAVAADQMVADGVPDLPWARGLGAPVSGPIFGLIDAAGCRAVGLTFSYGNITHCMCAVIGEQGGIRDCFVLDDAEALRHWFLEISLEPGVLYRDLPAAAARPILADALADPICPRDAEQAENIQTVIHLLRSRVALLPGS